MKKLFTLFFALVASIGTMFASITVSLDPESCSDWSVVRLWAWTTDIYGTTTNLFDSWPGIAVGKDSDGWWAYTFDESIKDVNIIWTDGTNQTIDITHVTKSTYYALESTTGKEINVSTLTPVSGTYKINDLYYNLDGTNKTAEVTSSVKYYYGTIVIPDFVKYKSLSPPSFERSISRKGFIK